MPLTYHFASNLTNCIRSEYIPVTSSESSNRAVHFVTFKHMRLELKRTDLLGFDLCTSQPQLSTPSTPNSKSRNHTTTPLPETIMSQQNPISLGDTNPVAEEPAIESDLVATVAMQNINFGEGSSVKEMDAKPEDSKQESNGGIGLLHIFSSPSVVSSTLTNGISVN